MSSIYIQEPPTLGKVLVVTSFGDLDIELWSREAPKACRNFVQLCMEGYYDGTIFHRIIKGFIAQGGDPTGTGTGGDSIYGRPFKDEFHSRLRFVRRGLIAMANSKKDDNGSQFFFTLGSCPELQNKNTIFGKVAGDTLYNMLKLDDTDVDYNDRPLYPPRVISTQVLSNPFPDIVPRVVAAKSADKAGDAVKQPKSKGTKNFKLLSFGDEAEEDEEETNTVAKEYRGKSKSSHDLANDPNLSSVPAVQTEESLQKDKRKAFDQEDEEKETAELKRRKVENVKQKLKKSHVDETTLATEQTAAVETTAQTTKPIEDDGDEDTKEKIQKRKVDEIRKEVQKLKKELTKKNNKDDDTKDEEDQGAEDSAKSEAVKEYYETKKKYSQLKREKKSKSNNQEDQTLALLNKFKEKLQTARAHQEEPDTDAQKNSPEQEANDEDDTDEGWWTHTLRFENQERLAKDANIANEDTFEIYDPRNPINQRRRDASKSAMKEKRRKY